MVLRKVWSAVAFIICFQSAIDAAGICGNATIRKHWSDCNKFVECGESSTVIFECPERSFFNSETLVCDFAMYAECVVDLEAEVQFFGQQRMLESAPGVLVTIDTCNQNPLGAKLPHPDFCNMFYHCSPSGPILFECPANLLFCPKRNVCNWPQFVECGITEGEVNGECPENCFPDKRCPLNCYPDLNTTVLPHPSMCTAYLRCIDGCACFQNCAAGLYWSTNLGRCVERVRSECVEIERPSCPECIMHENCPPVDDPNNPIRFPYPGRCDAYMKCHQGQACKVECPEGLEFDPETEVCDIPWGCVPGTTAVTTDGTDDPDETPITTPITTPEPPVTSPITTPDPPVTTPVTTPEPPVTTPITTPDPPVTTPITTPDPPVTTPITTPDPPVTTPITTPEPPVTTPDTTPITTPVTTPVVTTEPPLCPVCPPGVCHPDDRCPVDPCQECDPLLLPHPDDCAMFYKCTHGYACEMRCPSGLHWSSAMNRCEWPKLGDCALGEQ
ncbi:pollen-specific leucine-rich repeat extensin-like protein 2 isoform X2 [Aedes aegypti]|uniref:pollen-specific leucine-rich repeat extensin-like protein 2 isoform X2 n=1 Tax=Aedes aegypti TaxID=7159 RepID=UPI000B7877FA|nr:pollen-specific leucine-rich repeat extensin-like protein 2 isoform X2 [Aedes aegypti]